MEKVVNIVNKVLDGGSGGHSPPEAEAFLVFECETLLNPVLLKKKTRYCPPRRRSGGENTNNQVHIKEKDDQWEWWLIL